MKRRAGRLALLGAVFAVLGLIWWLAPAGTPRAQAGRPPHIRLSLLVLGDTGKPEYVVPVLDPQGAVARALEAEDRMARVDGLVLLGDNFYPNGLKERLFKTRLRDDFVAPYCRFLAFTPRGAGSMSETCSLSSDERHPVPIYAVLGNHDYGERESPMLQRTRIPEYVENWKMPREHVELHELPGGVSLVLFDSVALMLRSEERSVRRKLESALQDAQGPWRIVATHFPVANSGQAYTPAFTKAALEIFQAADVPVHVYLAGHEHNLQAIEMSPPGPFLNLIAGSGSDVREVEEGGPGRLFAEASLGFVRLDLERRDGEERLVGSFFRVEDRLAGAGEQHELVTRISVQRDGTVSKESVAVRAEP